MEVYCDESLCRGGYDLIGGLWLTAANARRLRGIVDEIRRRFAHGHEFKWTKPSGTALSAVYRDLAQKLTDQLWAGRASFHCIVLERRLVDYRTYHDGDPELGYYKFVHLLARKRVVPGQSFVLYMDRRTTRRANRLSDLKRIINLAARKDYGLGYDCCLDVQARPSKDDDLLQVADVLLGAVGWHCAGAHQNPASSMAKNELADRIANGIGRAHLALGSPPSEQRFNVWRWKPRFA